VLISVYQVVNMALDKLNFSIAINFIHIHLYAQTGTKMIINFLCF